jgi:hypothetical protein
MNMKKIVAPVLILFFSVSSVASALDVAGQSRTYLQSRETVDSTRLLPLYEYLDFDAGSFAGKTITFHFGGWYRYDLQNESFGETKDTGDLQYAYLSYRGEKSNSFLNLGRVVVNQGVASEQVDGMAAGADLRWGFGIAAFGGVPLETDSDSRQGDSVYGGRISQGSDGLYRIGVSYLLEKNDSAEFRKEEGVDLWFRPIDKAEILGALLYNAITSATAQTSLYLTLGPFKNLTLRTQYMDTSYKDYFTGTTLNAFQLISGNVGEIDPNEKLVLIGEEAAFSFGKANVSVDYKKYGYDIAGSANYYGAGVSYTGAESSGSGLAYHRMDGETADLQYSEYRAYTYRKFGKIDATVDALMINYDTAISGVENAYSIALAGGYPLSPKATLGADVEYQKNPYYDKDVRAFLKLVYNFDFATGNKNANADKGKSKKGRK